MSSPTGTISFEIPKKGTATVGDELFNHQARLNGEKTIKFARVREILGGYNTAEMMELLIDKAIEAYDDGVTPNQDLLPKNLKA